MTAALYQLPTAGPPAREGLNLSAEEVQDASGGYAYPARQLRELHARGFVLATIGRHGRVVLPRAHYEAVLSGQFRQAPRRSRAAGAAAEPGRA
jgi:hypothetical protein